MKLSLLALALLAGCATTTMGRKFDTDAAQKFKVGVTKKADVLAALGHPHRRRVDPTGNESWLYSYTETTAHVDPATLFVPFYTKVDSDTRAENLSLVFDGDLLKEMDLELPMPKEEREEAEDW